MTIEQIGMMILQMVAWSLGGILALFVARIAYNIMTPFDAKKELCDDKNAAVGASHGMYIVAAAIILHGLIVGERVATEWYIEMGVMALMYVIALVMLWLGRVALRALVPFNLDEEIHIKDNLAVGLVEGASYLGFAIIVHSAL